MHKELELQAESCRSHWIARQFVEPKGVFGWLAGQIMARRESNRLRNRWTLELLGVTRSHRVLELGCGPGWALSLACELARGGTVVGVDPSRTMLSLARRRNRKAIDSGMLRLVEARAEELPADLGGPFDCVFSSNLFGFLDDPAGVFQMLRAHIKPGSQLATTWLPRLGPKTDESVLAVAERIENICGGAGLVVTSRNFKRFGTTQACCVIAELPSET